MKAVCLACGQGKWGALTRCRHCGHYPEDAESQARHILTSAEHLEDAELAEVSRRVRGEHPLEFSEEQLRTLTAELEAIPVVPLWYALLVIGLPVSGLAAALVLLAWLLS